MAFFLHRVRGFFDAGDIWITTLHSQSSQGIDSVHNAWEQFVTDTLTNFMANHWPTSTHARHLETDRLDAQGHFTEQTISTMTIDGAAPSGGWSNTRDSVVIGKRTQLPTRAGRGRMYIPGPTTANTDSEGLLTSTFVNSASSTFSNALALMQGTTMPVVYHRGSDSGSAITAITVGVVLGGQNRRSNKIPPAYARTTV